MLVSHLPHQEVEEIVVALLQTKQPTTVQVTPPAICNETCRHVRLYFKGSQLIVSALSET